jgi:redox-sensing transcriptional repressor
MTRIPTNTVGRLIVYRRLLLAQVSAGAERIYSHELAGLANVTPVQVRRDLMFVAGSGSPAHGYDVRELAEGIGRVIDAPEGQGAVLVGVGNLGRALLSYLSNRHSKIDILAAFDSDPGKVDRVIAGCRCFHTEDMYEKVRALGASVGILAVPAARAPELAERLVEAGVSSILNFAPVPLRLRGGVHVEQVDIMAALEKAAHFAKRSRSKGAGRRRQEDGER